MSGKKHNKLLFSLSAAILLCIAPLVSCLDDDFDTAIKIEALPVEVLIPDKNEPVPGADGLITNNIVTPSSITVLWSQASDKETEQAALEYRLYISSSNTISTLADILEHGTVVEDWTTGMTTAIVSDLDPGTSYYFNVVVRDEDGLMAAYRMVSITTETDAIYLFPAGSFQGDIGMGGGEKVFVPVRENIDSLCMEARLDDYPALPCLNVRALISVSESDDIADMPDHFGVPTDRNVIGPSGSTVVNYWADLLDGSIDMMLADADVASDHWWSGSEADGTFDSENNCGGWLSTGDKGRAGLHDESGPAWIEGNTPNCSASRIVLCVCW